MRSRLEVLFGDRFISREEWGATASTAPSAYLPAQGIVVDQSSVGEEIVDWKALVRTIQAEHQGLGFGDITYHFLIDPFGNVYEGRSGGGNEPGVVRAASSLEVANVAAAAPSTLDEGAVTIDLLGAFLSDIEWSDLTPEERQEYIPGTPTEEALDAAQRLIAWLAQGVGQDSCFLIAERDVNDSQTVSPGWNVYSHLAAIREAVELQTRVELSPSSIHLPATGTRRDLRGSTAVLSTHWWQAYRGEEWIRLTNGLPSDDPLGRWIEQTGNGSVEFEVEENEGSAPRSGQVVIGGAIFTIYQDGSQGTTQTPSETVIPCAYSISPTSQTFGAGSGTGSISVTAQTGCTWTASSGAAWVSITSGASGSGNGTVNFSVQSNTCTGTRTATLTVAGETFTVTQAGVACSYTLSSSSRSFGAVGGTGTVGVTASVGCAWTATSNVPWITITSGASGSGNGTVSYSVQNLPSTDSRTGTMTIAGQTFTVTQSL